ncbi:inorganic diphosphatase [Candidatus Xianfuyuplasma coldseepsis]|uniref:Inorganic pyrophosphatase n=1 Tax=Candidatus Xianfuyuplasma coldseepsis TaxID=2782163 RepID=A0A7L7KT76_9MOLU|nr:inorganic diphosphatase [Xianfuyuplasma coldseepsis]QMS85599.1 inorganic diphosphatase [Xianfuyuplasma coldseepsis]
MDKIYEAIIEIPMGTKNKYEIDKANNRIKLDRVLYSPMTYPAEYGYIENTLAEDGDPLDILVLASSKTFPGCVVDARIVGYLDMVDNGEPDQKIIGVMNSDPRFSHINEVEDIQEHTKREIRHFFHTYKDLQQNKVVEVKEFYDKIDALELIQECKVRYDKAKK